MLLGMAEKTCLAYLHLVINTFYFLNQQGLWCLCAISACLPECIFYLQVFADKRLEYKNVFLTQLVIDLSFGKKQNLEIQEDNGVV